MKKGISTRLLLGLVATVVLGAALPAMAQGSSKPSSCTDIPLQVTIAGISNTSTGGIYGDQNPSASVYTDGVDGVYAKFQICNGSNDFIFNLNKSSRFFRADFSDQLVAGDPGSTQPTGPVQGVFMNVNEVANLALYVNGQLNTCQSDNVVLTPGMQDQVHYINSSVIQTTTNTGTPGCTDNVPAQAADKHSDTSIVRVTVGANCSLWTITPVPLAITVGTFDVAGLAEQTPKGWLSGGNYSMPFTITLTRTDNGGCAKLP